MIKVLLMFIVSYSINPCFSSGDIDVLNNHYNDHHNTINSRNNFLVSKEKSISLVNDTLINNQEDIKNLVKKDFFYLVSKAEEYTDEGNFHNAALHIMACACNTDMGEDYQHILYEVNPLTVNWIRDGYIDFKKLSNLLPKLTSYLESISMEKNISEKELSEYFSDSLVDPSISFNIIH